MSTSLLLINYRLRTLQAGQTREWHFTLQGTTGTAASVSASTGYTLQKQQEFNTDILKPSGYVVVVTTLDRLDAQGVLALYRYRWKVELAFK